MIRTVLYCTIFFSSVLMQSTLKASDWIHHGIKLTINNNFEEAEKYFLERIDKNPDDYRAYFYYAALLNSRMTHLESNTDEKLFNKYLDTTIGIIDSILADAVSLSDSVYARHLFYLGSSYGYRAFHDGQNKNWLAALSNGLQSNRILQKVIEVDSTCYDAYLGIGVYKYWRHSILKYFSWLPFVADERQEGINLIKKAINHSTYSKYIAMQQLIYILVHYSQPEEATGYAIQIVEKYPESQFMLWAAGHAYQKNRDLENAERVFTQLLEIIVEDPDYNPQHLIRCKIKLAEIYFETGKYERCITECEQLLLFLTGEQQDQIRHIEELLSSCREYSHQYGQENQE